MSGSQLALLGGPFGAGAQGDPNWQNVTLLSGTTTTNAGQNNNFIDSSGNGLNPTRNGNTTQGTFSPFSQANGYWSNYFDGTGDVIYATETSSQFTYGTGDYTYECWIYPTSDASTQRTIFGRTSTGNVAFPYIYLVTTTGVVSVYYSSTIVSGTTAIPSNTWTHIMVSRLSGTTRIFVNGVQEGSASDSANLTSPTAVMIGGSGTASANPFTGYISNARILKGTGYSSITVPTTPLTAITNTQLLTCQSNRFVDNSTNAFAITVNGNPAVVPFQPFGAPIVPYSASTIGGSGYFDGTGDSLSVTTNSSFVISGDFTIEFWAYFTSTGTFQPLLDQYNDAGFLFRVSPGSTINGDWYINSTSGSDGIGSFSGTACPINAWNFFRLIRSGSTVTVYCNGVSVGTRTRTGNIFANNATLNIANYSTNYFTGYLSGLRIVPTALTGTEIPTSPPTVLSNTRLLLNYTNANIYDQAAKNDLETVGNAQVSTSVKKFGDSSSYFDGAGDYLKFPTSNLFNPYQGQYTVEMWIYPTSLSSGGTASSRYGTLLNQETPGSSIQWGLGFNSSGQLVYTYWNGSATVQITGSGGIAVNAWSYVGFIYINNSLALFVNGNLSALTAITTPSSSTTEPMFIGLEGRTNGSELYYQGYISDLRITKGLARYPYNFTPPTTSLPNFYQAQTLTADPYFEYTTLLLPGSGTNLSNNNAFLDSSGNGFNPTRNGNTTQGTFSPFSQTGWSNYFNGSSTVGVAYNSAFQPNTYVSLECWVYFNSLASDQLIIGREGMWLNYSYTAIGTTSTKIGFSIYNNSGSWITASSTTTPSVGQWYHIVGVRDNTTLRIYINGVQEATATFSGTPNTHTSAFAIGGSFTNSNNITGYVSNARYCNGSTSNTLPYTGTSFTVPTSPLTVSTNTILLTCQSNRFVDNSTSPYTITTSGSPSVQAFSPFAPTAAYSAGTNGGSGYFDGTGDYLSVAGASQLRPGTGDFTLEGWFYLTNFTGDKYLINQNFNNADGSFGNFLIYVTGTTGVMKYWSSTTGSSWNNVAGIALGTAKLNEWFHVAVSRLSGTTKTFLNGVEQASQADSGNLNNTGGIYVGTYAPGQANVNGYASGVRLLVGTGYSSISIPTAPPTAITNTSLLLNFTNAGITDATAKNDLETVGNAQISNGAAKWGSTSMYFDGNGDQLLSTVSPNLQLGSGDFTIECWLRRSSASSAQAAILQMSAGTDSYSLLFGYTSSSTLVVYISSNNSSWDIASAQTLGSVQNDTWVHYALVRYGSTFITFQNGQQQATWTSSASIYQASNQVSVAYAQATHQMAGYIQDLRITKGIARYTQNFTPPTAAFQLL